MADWPYERDVDEAHEREHRALVWPGADKPSFPRARALAVAQHLVAAIEHACERVEIAGSLRRGVELVKDVEIVAQPRICRDLFGAPTGRDELAFVIEQRIREGVLEWRPPQKGIGKAKRYYALRHAPSGIAVDLFVQRPPTQWGALLAIRTGPGDYSKRLVTECKKHGLRCVDLHLVREDGTTVETPDEQSFINACGLPYAEPWERR